MSGIGLLKQAAKKKHLSMIGKGSRSQAAERFVSVGAAVVGAVLGGAVVEERPFRAA